MYDKDNIYDRIMRKCDLLFQCKDLSERFSYLTGLQGRINSRNKYLYFCLFFNVAFSLCSFVWYSSIPNKHTYNDGITVFVVTVLLNVVEIVCFIIKYKTNVRLLKQGCLYEAKEMIKNELIGYRDDQVVNVVVKLQKDFSTSTFGGYVKKMSLLSIVSIAVPAFFAAIVVVFDVAYEHSMILLYVFLFMHIGPMIFLLFIVNSEESQIFIKACGGVYDWILKKDRY